MANADQRVGRLSEALEVLRRDRNEKGTLSIAAHRQIAKLEALRGRDADTEHRSDPQVRDEDGEVPGDAVEASVADERRKGKSQERVTALGTSTRVRAFSVTFERILEDFLEEKILQGDELFGRCLCNVIGSQRRGCMGGSSPRVRLVGWICWPWTPAPEAWS